MVANGDKLLLWHPKKIFMIDADGETKKISGLGIVDTSKLVRKDYGEKVKLGRREYVLLQPAAKYLPEIFNRKAQIIIPRVAAQISHYCDVKCGDTVVEGGSGSGMLTAILARSVGPNGHVFSYEKREDHLGTAEKNLQRIGMSNRITFTRGDITEDVKETNVDAFIVDMPQPWDAVPMANEALKGGGFFAAYIPTTNQLEKVYKTMKEEGYIDLKAFESLERDIHVGERGVRPSFDMLGHTGFIAVGRKTVDI